MKKTFLLSLFCLYFMTGIAQVPEAIHYQTIIRDQDGNLIVSQNVGFRVLIIKDNMFGANVYVETHNTQTNTFGLVTLAIGTGTPVLNDFSDIAWESGTYFLKLEIDVSGGTNYTSVGDPVQILSVPYAMYALEAGKQSLSISNDTIFLSDGGFVKLPPVYLTNPFPGSTLLSETEQVLLNNWIGNPLQKWTKCYTKTTDGASSVTFHSQCDNRGPTVTVIKLDNGFVLGGYIQDSWYGGAGNYLKSYGFIFSITNQKKYPLGFNAQYSYYNHTGFGPTYGGGHDIYITSSMNLGYVNFPHTYAWNGTVSSMSDDACQELAGVNRAVTANVTELEVWILDY